MFNCLHGKKISGGYTVAKDELADTHQRQHLNAVFIAHDGSCLSVLLKDKELLSYMLL